MGGKVRKTFLNVMIQVLNVNFEKGSSKNVTLSYHIEILIDIGQWECDKTKIILSSMFHLNVKIIAMWVDNSLFKKC